MPTTDSVRALDLRPEEVQLAAMSDLGLVEAIYRLVLDHVEDDRLRDAFYRHLEEAFERFAPEVEWANVEGQYENNPNREAELRSARESFERRAAGRLLLGPESKES